MEVMRLGKVYNLLAMESLNLSQISLLNSMISSYSSLSTSLDRSEASQFMRLRLFSRDFSSYEQFQRQCSYSSLSSGLNYIFMHTSDQLINQSEQGREENVELLIGWNTPYYISKEFIADIKGEEVLERYPNVEVFIDEMKIVGMTLEVTSHRLIFRSNTAQSLLVKGQSIHDVSITESGFFNKDYFVKLHTQFGKLKMALKSHNQAKVTIDAMIKKKAWLVSKQEKKNEGAAMYSGLFNKIREENQVIQSQSQAVSGSFQNFDKLFGNLRDIKKVMASMKEASGQTDGDNPQVNKILKDMGFVSVISKDEAGRDYYQHLAKDLYQVCQGSLFKNYGGVVALLDLFYFYNKKRQLNLLSPEEVVTACQLFPSLGLQAKLVRYPNNIILVESTTFDPAADFEENFAKFFPDYHTGLTAEQVARRKGLPVAIVEIKLRNACKAGKLAISDRIEGIKYYKNLLLTI